mgnify:FL=1
MKTPKSTSAFSKEELKIVNAKFKKQLKERNEQLKGNLIALEQHKEFLNVLKSFDCNTTTGDRVDYPLQSIAHNLCVMYPEQTFMFIEPCLHVTRYCISKYKELHKGWKLRFLKRTKEYYRYTKLLNHLEELAKANDKGELIVKPFGDTVMWLQDNAPEMTSYFVEQLLNINEQLISYTLITLDNYSKLTLD